MNRWSIPIVCLAVTLTGCSSQSMAKIDPTQPGTSTDPTFYADVLPLAQKHCAGCHYPGGIGPFSMLTYEDALPHAQVIATEVEAGIMPPWLPSATCRPLEGNRTMTADEKATFVSWASGKKLQGDSSLAQPYVPAETGLARVDRTMAMAQAYTPPANETDHYQCFILDPKLTADADLIAYNVKPGAAKEVHHVLLYPASPADAQQLDDATPNEIGWTCFGGPGTSQTQTVGGWVPGSSAVTFPSTTGIQIPAGDVLVMQVHYNLNYTTPVPDLTTVELELAQTPVALHATMMMILNNTFSVPPGATNYEVNASQQAPGAATIWGVLPHAHTHAQKMHVDGDAGCMVDIAAWDFHWQQQYFFTSPATVKKGDHITLKCTYDNPGSVPLTWGEKTTDEMCLSFLYVTQ
ncbi:MAG: hypothetical protein ABI321_01805 [Polyangia bacterium]